MYLNSVASPCSDPAFRRPQYIQDGHRSLPSIPEDLVQPLRDALPKIDEALLSSVPVEVLPLCQQLFSTWLSTSTSIANIPPPPRAQTTMNIASLCQPPSPILSQEQQCHYQQQERNYPQQHRDQNYEQQQFAETSVSLNTKLTSPNQCRKSQSTSRLSSWFSWSLPKRKNASVAPMVPRPKTSAYQNISDVSPANATTTPFHAKSSTSTMSVSTTPRIDLSQPQPHDSYILQKQLPQTPSQIRKSIQRLPPPLPQRSQSHQTHKSYQQIHHLSQSSHQQNTRQSHHSLGLSPSLSSSSSTTTSDSTSATFLSRANDGGSGSYRRSVSFMLSKFGTKVRRVIHSKSQRIYPQPKSSNSTSKMPFTSLSQINLPELHNLPPSALSSSQKRSLQNIPAAISSPSMSNSCKLKTSVSVGTMIYNNAMAMEKKSDGAPISPKNGNGSVQVNNNEYSGIHLSLLLDHQSRPQQQSPSISSWKEVTYDLVPSSPATNQQQATTPVTKQPLSSTAPREHLLSNNDYSDYSEYDSANDTEDDGDHDPHRNIDLGGNTTVTEENNSDGNDENDTTNLKTPWSPPESLARRTLRSSKTDTNMKHKVSVPFIKMGLGRKSVDVDDQAQYTTRSISSTSFTLQWQEKFHDQQQPRERIASTLKSVSLALYDIVRHNHAYQQFTSDTAYVAHPDLNPGEDTRELFSTVPMTHWRDIFDQIAYIFENGVLTAEHAIITVIYIERMLENSKQHLCEANWRLIVLAGLITSIKVWDDCAVHNMDFLQIFPELDIKHINLIERRFLEHIDWDVSVRCSLFASTYFELQEHR